MKKIEELRRYFTKGERALWFGSVFVIIAAFYFFDRSNYFTLFASLLGVTSLIFNAKGNPFGQLLMILFSLLYGIISFTFSYYGEMLTYVGMTMPMAVFALISWLKNPFNGNRMEVSVNHLARTEWRFMYLAAILVTALFYFILGYFQTANLVPSTLSVTTSFIAVYLTYKRSPYYALGYAANDIVLIVLWILAARQNTSYLSVVVCFTAFLVNDIYGFINCRLKACKGIDSTQAPYKRARPQAAHYCACAFGSRALAFICFSRTAWAPKENRTAAAEAPAEPLAFPARTYTARRH